MILNTYILCCSPNIHSSPPSIWYNHIFPPLWSQVWRCTFFRQWHTSRSDKYNTWEEALRTTGWSITFPFSYFSDCKCISMQTSLAWVPEWLQWAKLPSTSDSQVGVRSDLCRYNPPRCGGYLFLWHNPAAPDLNTLCTYVFLFISVLCLQLDPKFFERSNCALQSFDFPFPVQYLKHCRHFINVYWLQAVVMTMMLVVVEKKRTMTWSQHQVYFTF